MPKTKKKFIDKKNAVSFHLVHRSQQDPLIADEKAPQHVLLPASENNAKEFGTEKRREEQKKYGIFFDDDYDYLQHLRNVNSTNVELELVNQPTNQTPKLKLPSSVFASEVEENVGLLNKAAPHSGPRLDMDPDIVAAMDEDFDYEDPDNELEDNFIELANAEGGGSENDSDRSSYSTGNISDEEDDEVGSLDGPQYNFAEEETKSHFTNYSMSSSVIRRNEKLSLLDDCFEKMFVSSYGDTEIGSLECEEIEGYIQPDSDLLIKYAQEIEEERKLNRGILDPEPGSHKKGNESDDDEEEEEELVPVELRPDPKERWDCESILSTYSNIYNRPKLISEPVVPKKIQVSGKTGIPLGVLDSGSKLTARALARHNDANNINGQKDEETESVMSTLSILSIRPKNETPEERLQRLKALKQYRRERRMEKKANTLAFKEEKKKQEKVILNNKLNIQGLHIP